MTGQDGPDRMRQMPRRPMSFRPKDPALPCSLANLPTSDRIGCIRGLGGPAVTVAQRLDWTPTLTATSAALLPATRTLIALR